MKWKNEKNWKRGRPADATTFPANFQGPSLGPNCFQFIWFLHFMKSPKPSRFQLISLMSFMKPPPKLSRFQLIFWSSYVKPRIVLIRKPRIFFFFWPGFIELLGNFVWFHDNFDMKTWNLGWFHVTPKWNKLKPQVSAPGLGGFTILENQINWNQRFHLLAGSEGRSEGRNGARSAEWRPERRPSDPARRWIPIVSIFWFSSIMNTT